MWIERYGEDKKTEDEKKIGRMSEEGCDKRGRRREDDGMRIKRYGEDKKRLRMKKKKIGKVRVKKGAAGEEEEKGKMMIWAQKDIEKIT